MSIWSSPPLPAAALPRPLARDLARASGCAERADFGRPFEPDFARVFPFEPDFARVFAFEPDFARVFPFELEFARAADRAGFARALEPFC